MSVAKPSLDDRNVTINDSCTVMMELFYLCGDAEVMIILLMAWRVPTNLMCDLMIVVF